MQNFYQGYYVRGSLLSCFTLNAQVEVHYFQGGTILSGLNGILPVLIIPSLITDLKELFLFFLQSNFFDEYRIEGKDETNNIYLELMPDNLMRAMKSASSAQAVKIKLTKKHTPCLTFEITLVRYNLIQNLLF